MQIFWGKIHGWFVLLKCTAEKIISCQSPSECNWYSNWVANQFVNHFREVVWNQLQCGLGAHAMRVNTKWRLSELCVCANDLTQRIRGSYYSVGWGRKRLEQAWFAVVSFPSLLIVQFLTTSSKLKTQCGQKWTVGRPGNNTNLQRSSRSCVLPQVSLSLWWILFKVPTFNQVSNRLAFTRWMQSSVSCKRISVHSKPAKT